MAGIAQYHFPRCVWNNGRRMLWNPIQKKVLKNRPEERVRLRIIEALTEMGWSKNRISTEETVAAGDREGLRTDIICYDRGFSPKLLVECKAEQVPITTGVAEQTARYNRTVEAPYLLMSNGITDLWYHLSGRQEIRRLDGIPDFLTPPAEPPDREFDYWCGRGFAGEDAGQELRESLVTALNLFWLRLPGEIRFIPFGDSPAGADLAHYYKIFGEESKRTAVGFLSTPGGGSRLIAVFSRDGENRAVLETDLDLLAVPETANAFLHASTGSREFDIRQFGLSAAAIAEKQFLDELPSLLNTLFDRLTP